MEGRNLKLGFVLITIVGTSLGVGMMLATPRATLTIQTTTSMQDSGLLDLIKPAFEAEYFCNMRWVAVGTGQALANAALGQGDVVIVHSNSSERAFINHTDTSQSYSGHGIFRVHIAYNWYVIVGPVADPLEISVSAIEGNASEIFRKIYTYGHANATAIFASRGDGSGTYNKEVSIWSGKTLKLWDATSSWPKDEPQPSAWYKSLGKGMGPTLIYANEQGAYTLTDYGTWLNMRKGLTNLKVVSLLQCNELLNTYSVIAVDPDKHPNVNFDLARKFIYFMCREGQNIIGNYTIDGEQVFYKWVSPDCFCHSPLCDTENGVFHLVSAGHSAGTICCSDCGLVIEPRLPMSKYSLVP